MNLRLWQRLFLTFAALASIALAGFVVWQQQAFRRGFLAYLDQAALERLQPVSDRLAEAYADNGSWEFLQNDIQQFGELIVPDLRRARRQPNRVERPRTPPPADAKDQSDDVRHHPPVSAEWRGHERDSRRRMLESNLLSRLLLVDAQGAPVVGDPAIARSSASVPIMLDGERVGSLLLAALPRIRSDADLAFAREQLRNALVAGVAILALALMLAFTLARWLLTPVRARVRSPRATMRDALVIVVAMSWVRWRRTSTISRVPLNNTAKRAVAGVPISPTSCARR